MLREDQALPLIRAHQQSDVLQRDLGERGAERRGLKLYGVLLRELRREGRGEIPIHQAGLDRTGRPLSGARVAPASELHRPPSR